MAIRMPRIVNPKQILRCSSSNLVPSAGSTANVPRGCVAVYVGEQEKKRFVIPISFLSQPSLIDLLNHVEEEFGFDHPMGGLTIPCTEDIFINLRCISLQ